MTALRMFVLAAMVAGCSNNLSAAAADTRPRVLVETTVIDADRATLANLWPNALAESAARADVRGYTSSHTLVFDGAASRAGVYRPATTTIVTPTIVDARHVRLDVVTGGTDGETRAAIVLADHEPTVVPSLGAPDRLVVVEATIVRTDADLQAILRRKGAPRATTTRP